MKPRLLQKTRARAWIIDLDCALNRCHVDESIIPSEMSQLTPEQMNIWRDRMLANGAKP